MMGGMDPEEAMLMSMDPEDEDGGPAAMGGAATKKRLGIDSAHMVCAMAEILGYVGPDVEKQY